MTKLKKVVSLLMVFVMCLSFSTAVHAEETDSKLRYGEREEITVLKTEYVTKTVTPSGQSEGGIRLSGGGQIYVNLSDGPNVTLDLGVSWGVVGVSTSIGLVGDSSSIGGVALTVPNTRDFFLAKIDKKYKVQYKKVDVYQYNIYDRTYYVSVPTLYSQNAYLVKV